MCGILPDRIISAGGKFCKRLLGGVCFLVGSRHDQSSCVLIDPLERGANLLFRFAHDFGDAVNGFILTISEVADFPFRARKG
jgi:hypothetical protein